VPTAVIRAVGFRSRSRRSLSPMLWWSRSREN